jgi:hypothetical protein
MGKDSGHMRLGRHLHSASARHASASFYTAPRPDRRRELHIELAHRRQDLGKD